MKDLLKLSGIYKIVNKLSGRVYIGSAKKFSTRFYQHRNSLLKNKHGNKFLQSDFNKYFDQFGNDDFLVFEIVEIVVGTTRQIRLVEQKYVNKYFDSQLNCYNLKKKTIKKGKEIWSSNPVETKKKVSDSVKSNWANDLERKQKLSERTKKLWEDPDYREKMKLTRTGQRRSKETREKLREQKLGDKNPMFGKDVSKETREKMSKARKGKKLKSRAPNIKKQYKELKKLEEYNLFSDSKARLN